MAYNIMTVKKAGSNYSSLYQFITTTTDGVTTPLSIATKDELDKKVESMLNDGGYAKSDFIVVEVIDYTIDATAYSDDEEEEEAEAEDDTETETKEEETA